MSYLGMTPSTMKSSANDIKTIGPIYSYFRKLKCHKIHVGAKKMKSPDLNVHGSIRCRGIYVHLGDLISSDGTRRGRRMLNNEMALIPRK